MGFLVCCIHFFNKSFHAKNVVSTWPSCSKSTLFFFIFILFFYEVSFKRISVVTSGQWKVIVCFEQANCLSRKILIFWYLKHAACVHKWLWSAWASSTRRFLLKSMTQFDECLYIVRMCISNSLYAVDGYSVLNTSPIIYDKPLVRFFRQCPFFWSTCNIHVVSGVVSTLETSWPEVLLDWEGEGGCEWFCRLRHSPRGRKFRRKLSIEIK